MSSTVGTNDDSQGITAGVLFLLPSSLWVPVLFLPLLIRVPLTPLWLAYISRIAPGAQPVTPTPFILLVSYTLTLGKKKTSFSLSLLSNPHFFSWPMLSIPSHSRSIPGELDQRPNCLLVPGEVLVASPRARLRAMTTSIECLLYARHCTDFHGHVTSPLNYPSRRNCYILWL